MKHEQRTKVNPKQRKVRSHRIEISVLDYGNEDATPMLILHGMRDLAWSLDPVARHFSRSHRVISMDLRGHGDSDHVGYYAFSHFIIDVRQVIRQLELERPVLVGHSFGGEVAAQFAGLFPEVPSACVLIEGLGPPPWEGEGSREAGLFWARSAIEAIDEVDPDGRAVPSIEAGIERIRRNHPGLDAERAQFLAEVGIRAGGDGRLRWKWDPFLRTTWGSFNFQQMEEMWRRIDCPTLAVNGARSGEFWRRDMGGATRGGDYEAYLPPDELKRRLDCFSDVECVEIPDASHMIHFDAPEALNEAMTTFLSKLGKE